MLASCIMLCYMLLQHSIAIIVPPAPCPTLPPGPFHGHAYIQEGTGSVRFVSVPDFSEIHRFGSVRFGTIIFPGSMRFGLRFSDAWWLGPVRFCSVLRSVPAVSEIQRIGSVRFGRSGSISYFFLTVYEWSIRQTSDCELVEPSKHIVYIHIYIHVYTYIYIYIYTYTYIYIYI